MVDPLFEKQRAMIVTYNGMAPWTQGDEAVDPYKFVIRLTFKLLDFDLAPGMQDRMLPYRLEFQLDRGPMKEEDSGIISERGSKHVVSEK